MDLEKEKQLHLIQEMNKAYQASQEYRGGKRRYNLLNPALVKKGKHNFNMNVLHRDNPTLYRRIYSRLYYHKCIKYHKYDLE